MFTALFEKVSLPLGIVDTSGKIVFANQGLQSLTGFSSNELLDSTVKGICAPYERSRFLFSNLALIRDTSEFEIDLRRKNGPFFMANVSFSPFSYRGAFFLLLSVRDVTDRRVQEGKTREEGDRYRKLLAERNQLEKQLKQSSKLATLGELAAGIAHEINNPLGIILGFTQEVLEEISKDHPLFESIKIIEQETARCVEVVKNMLDFARLKPPQIAEVDLVQLLKHTLTLLAPKLRKYHIQTQKSYPKRFLLIKADSQLLQQAVLNVMLNAIQAMPLGGCITVDLRETDRFNSEKSGRWIEIVISDTGSGIHPKNLERVFDPFFSTKGSKGTGLGLSVCQRIIEDHGGKIEMESRLGLGTVCRIYLQAP